MIDTSRLQRAIHLEVEQTEDGAWTVTGGATPHTVRGDTCDCTDFSMRGGMCKHRLAVGLHQGNAEVLTALRELVPTQQRKRKAVDNHIEYADPPERIVPLGALAQWEEEVSRGDWGQRRDAPSTWIMDDLWRAAAYEATALEAERHGAHSAARDAMDRAIHILAESHNRDSVAA